MNPFLRLLITMSAILVCLDATFQNGSSSEESNEPSEKDDEDSLVISIGNNFILKECKHGIFLVNPMDTYVGRSLQIYGEWSENELSLFHKFISEGDLVMDIGANIGAFTVPLSRFVGENGRVLAFEPQRVISQQLGANVAMNNLGNVEINNVAVGSVESVIEVPRINYGIPGNFGAVSLLSNWSSEGALVEAVRQISLDDVFYFEGSHCPSFIKIDVEGGTFQPIFTLVLKMKGMEADVLKGGEMLIAACKPVLHVENNCGDKSSNLIDALTSMNYICYWDVHKYFNENNFANQSESIFPDGVVAINMLCIPESSDDSSRLMIMKDQEHLKIDVENKKYLSNQYNFILAGIQETVQQHECKYTTAAEHEKDTN